jgi:segregation and condensation protein B
MLKAKIEAILFLTDKPMRAQAIARIVNEDVQVVRQSLLELVHDYEERQSGLEIADDNGYIIQVKDQYSAIIDEFVPMEMPVALVRTLSAIAIKQPVAQSEIIKIRGAGAYDHIKELVERDLVTKKEDGRSPMLSTTKKFQEYFRLSQDAKSLRNELRKEEKKEAQAAAEGEELPVQLPIEAVGLDAVAQFPNDSGIALPDAPKAAKATSAAKSGHDAPPEADYDDKEEELTPSKLEELFEASPDSSFVYRPADMVTTEESATGEGQTAAMPPNSDSTDSIDE